MDGLQRSDAVKDEDAVEVIQLMLDGTRFKTVGPQVGSVRRPHPDTYCPVDVGRDIGQAQAAFSCAVTSGLFGDLRFDHDHESAARGCQSMATHVHYCDTDRHAYLGRCQPDAAGVGCHCVHQIIGNTERSLHRGGLAYPLEHRMREGENAADH